MPHTPVDLSHRLVRMTGRDPNEPGRVATTLELLLDLTFVVAFGIAGEQFAHLMVEGQAGLAVLGFVFATFAIVWAWINFAWFASAFDTDDWFYRVVTMVQMVGVVVLALGLPTFFGSLHHGHVDNTTMVSGYVVMRVAMLIQWSRAYVQAPVCRPGALRYIITLVVTQASWVVLAVLHTSLAVFLEVGVVLVLVELAGPMLAERQNTERPDGQAMTTPWHPHHIAERYGLLVIITLGEGVVGTVAALSGAVEAAGGWTLQAVLVVVAGIGLTFGLWWVYFSVDWAQALHAHPERGFGWGYGHILLFMGIAGTGAGLHVAGYVIEGQTEHISPAAAVATVVVPVAVFVVLLFLLYGRLLRAFDRLHVVLLVLTAGVLVVSAVLALLGVSMGWCLIVIMLAPVVTIVGFESVGHRHAEQHLANLHSS